MAPVVYPIFPGSDLTLTNNFEWAYHLEVWCEGVRQPHVAWEGTENKVSHLDAVRRDDITE